MLLRGKVHMRSDRFFFFFFFTGRKETHNIFKWDFTVLGCRDPERIAVRLKGHDDGGESIVFSSDGKKLGSTGVRVWDEEMGEAIGNVVELYRVHSVAFFI